MTNNHTHPSRIFAKAALAIVAFVTAAHADVQPSALFSDHAVLQANVEIPIWGKADPGENVTVSYLDQKVSATADETGKWTTKLPPMPAGKSGDLTMTGNNAVVAKNVITGEVWLCSGQSNMAFFLSKAESGADEAANASDPDIRFFQVKRSEQADPADELTGRWMVCKRNSLANVSAVAYFFGKELRTALDVPVGLIVSAVGGTQIQAWMSEQALTALPIYDGLVEDLAAERNASAQALAEWNEKQKEGTAGPKPRVSPRTLSHGSLFNGMIAPLVPYAIRGAIWYQGEGNSQKRQSAYGDLLTALIADWRSRWNEEFWFAWVQLPEFRAPQSDPVEEGAAWPVIREEMLNTLQVPKTGMAVAMGLGDPRNIHPTNKRDVGWRLAQWALGEVYSLPKIATSGPIYSGHEIREDQVIISFTHTDGGLVAKDAGSDLKGFAVAGEDKVWHSANATIDADTIVVSCEAVTKPIAVRYAWADNPAFNVYNGAGLPASPFRTDDFPFPKELDGKAIDDQ